MLGHWIFLGLFYAVLAVIAVTLADAFWQTFRDFRARREETIRWQATFPDLPAEARICRHQLTGEFRHRLCNRAFDCRGCEQHAALTARHPATPATRCYHRGHTWVQPEPDGTATIGLDALGESLTANPDTVSLPAPGSRLQTNGDGWHMRKNGADVRILSPVEGEVVATGGPGQGWFLKVKPADGGFDMRHLLRGAEADLWTKREMDRLYGAFPATMADGGLPVNDIAAALPESRWRAVCEDIFLMP